MKRKSSVSSQGRYTKKSKPSSKPSYKRQNASSMLKPELKFNDVAVTGDASTTETVVALTSFAAGDTALLRDGNKIIAKSLDVRLLIGNEALTQNNTVRFVIVCAYQANAAASTWFTGVAGLDAYDASTVTARRAVETVTRYKVLMDETVVLNQTSGTGGALQQAYLHRYVKIPKDCQLAQYASSASSIPITNSLSLMYVGSTASGATDVDVVGTVRLRFQG